MFEIVQLNPSDYPRQKHFTFANYEGTGDELVEEITLPALLKVQNLRTVTTSYKAVTATSYHKQLLSKISLQYLILQAPRYAVRPLFDVPQQLRHLVRLDTGSFAVTSFPPSVPPIAPENPVWLPMLASTPEQRVEIWTKIIRFASEPPASFDDSDSWRRLDWWRHVPPGMSSFHMDIIKATIGSCYSVSREFNVILFSRLCPAVSQS